MDVIWDESWRVLSASRVAYLDVLHIKQQIHSTDVLVLVADIGSDLIRLSGADVDAFWEKEASLRVVEPDKADTEFSLEDYPDSYCYLVSEWAGPDLNRPTILFERYH
jgi:hypothetical protein